MKRLFYLAVLAALVADSVGCTSGMRLWPWRKDAQEQTIYMAPECSAAVAPRACGVVESGCPMNTTTAYPISPAPVPVVGE